jgi:hypothetical protein
MENQNSQLLEAGGFPEARYNGGLIRRIGNREALTRCLDLLVELRESIREDGFSPEDDERSLTVIYGGFDPQHWAPNLFKPYFAWSKIASVSDKIRKEHDLHSVEECKENFLEELEDEIKRLKHYQKEQASVESSRTKLERLRRTCPTHRGWTH